MRSWLKFVAGVAVGALAVIALVGAIGTASAQPPSPQGQQPLTTPTPGARNPLHEDMDEWMDQMMGTGFSEKMHEAMSGSDEMIEACNSMMEAAGQEGTGNPMGNMGSMMGSGMMGGRRTY